MMKRIYAQTGSKVFAHVSIAGGVRWELLDNKTRACVAKKLEVLLQDCVFEVDLDLLADSRLTQRPVVHGGVIGSLRDDLTEKALSDIWRKHEIVYYWQEKDYFELKDTGERIDSANWILLDRHGCWLLEDFHE